MSNNNDSIESKVPGEQQLRGVSNEIVPNSTNSNSDNNDDCTYTPVLNITKEETTWTKGGVKLQKVTVGDAETTTVNESVSVMESSSPNSVRTEIHTEITISTRSEEGSNDNHEGTKTEGEEQKDTKKTTKIPKFKLKQAVDKIKQEEQISQEKIVHEPFLGRKVQSAIPRLKDIKPAQNNQINQNKNDEDQKNQKQESPPLDDEFDKLYEEIVEKDAFNNNIQTPDKLDEISKVETKFEEIIHSYEDTKSQTIVTEKVKSKIPLLKRKSEQDMDIPPQIRKSSLKKSISNDDTKSKIAVAQTKDKIAKTEIGKARITNSSASSESYSSETKSETFSAQASESITTNVTKTVITQISTSEEQVSISSKENLKEQNINNNISKKSSTTPQDVQKCRIPVLSQTKKKIETKASKNVEVKEQVTSETVKTITVDHSINNEETKSENKVDVKQGLKSNTPTPDVKSDIEEKLASKISTSLNENISEDQSLHTSENISLRNTSSDNTKVTEITKVNTKIEDNVTSEVKGAVQVVENGKLAESESKSIIGNSQKTLNETVTEGSTTATSDNSIITKITKVNTEIENHVTSEVKETVQVATLKYDASLDFETKSKTNHVDVTTSNKTIVEGAAVSSNSTNITEITKVNTEVKDHVTSEVTENIQVANIKKDTSLEAEVKNAIIDNSKISFSKETVIEGSTSLTTGVTTKEVTTFYTNASKTETLIESNVQNAENQNNQNNLDSSVEITNVSPNVNDTTGAKNQNNIEEVTNIKSETKIGDIKKDSNESSTETITITTIKSVVSDNVKEQEKVEYKDQILHSEKDETICDKNKEISKQKEKEQQQNISVNKTSNHQSVTESNKKSSDNLIQNGEKDKSKSVTNKLSTEIKNMEDLEEEDIIILKGKVSRIISRLDSREPQINKTDVDVPKNVSVMSKIANFEKSDATNTLHTETKTAPVIENKPKIVHEILKETENTVNNDHNTKANKNVTKTDQNTDKDFKNNFKKTSEESPYDNINIQSNYYAIYNKVHSSIINRLNSIEMKFKTGEIQRTELQHQISNISETEINNLKERLSASEPNLSRQPQTPIDEVFTSDLKMDTKMTTSVDTKLATNVDTKFATDVDTKEATKVDMYKEYRPKKVDVDKRAKSVAELDIGDAVKGRVRQMVYRMNSMERMRMLMRSDTVDRKEKLRKISITDRVAMFEKKVIPVHAEETTHRSPSKSTTPQTKTWSDEELQEKIAELANAKNKYGRWRNMTSVELRDGSTMPALAVGTALLDPQLVKHIVSAAIDLGYRAIDTAFIYGNEKQVGEAIRAKIDDGTVTREELFIMSKLWSTFHRRDLVMKACKQSLETMGLDYFDLYLIHNPMSFKEGSNPLPKIANVLQYSEHDYLEAWYGIEDVIRKGLVKRGGVSNFNSVQVERVVDKGKIKPVVNQVECHPYLTQQRLDDFCVTRNVKLSCFGVLGSKGTPIELKSGLPPAIDDPLVKVMSAGLGVTPAQLLIAYQLYAGRSVVVKSSSASHLWDNLQALTVKLDQAQVSALNALNRNKRTFTFAGMGDTHRNYPFKIAF